MARKGILKLTTISTLTTLVYVLVASKLNTTNIMYSKMPKTMVKQLARWIQPESRCLIPKPVGKIASSSSSVADGDITAALTAGWHRPTFHGRSDDN